MSRHAVVEVKIEPTVNEWEVCVQLREYIKRLAERCGWGITLTKGPWLSSGVKGRRYWRAHIAIGQYEPYSVRRRLVWDDFSGRKPYWKVAS